MATKVDNSVGPSAADLQDYLGALHWSLIRQKDLMELVNSVTEFYHDLVKETKSSVLKTIDEGISGLNEVAKSGKGRFNIDLMNLAVQTGIGLATGGPGGATAAFSTSLVSDTLKKTVDGISVTHKMQGSAESIVDALTSSINNVELALDRGVGGVERTFDEIWEAMANVRYPIRSGSGDKREVGLELPLPLVAKSDYQQPDDWRFPTPE